eukprot:TRINITY_DN4332_c0_g1_i1.p1 TRINITY_DN4332_c0_g1~~TRINITY_DN4332_c0_g1_i1.p1  ORF type:complete len:416 (+),score=58.25 TRINITY_DN4332_c0_g1_i1:77-1249(+)
MANSTTAGRRAQDGCYLIESQSDAETHSGSHINSSCNSPRASYCEDDGNDVERLYPQWERSNAGGTWAVLNYPKRPMALGDDVLELNPVLTQLDDARRHEFGSDEDTLDTRGFKLVQHNTQVQDFGNLAEMQNVFYNELEELCKKCINGVERCFVFDHKCRRAGNTTHAGSWSEQMESFALNPSDPRKGHSPAIAVGGYGRVIKQLELVHGDYTRPDAFRRVRALAKVPSWDSTCNFAPQLSDGEVQDIIANKRFMLINVWRNIDRGRAVRRFPLACLDASTVNDEDIFDWVPPRSNFPVYDGFAAHPDNFVAGQLCLEANERHRWFYFPELTFSEALLFKTFDSAAATVGREKLARACFHTAFQDPATETHDPDRQSCEARLLVLLRSE